MLMKLQRKIKPIRLLYSILTLLLLAGLPHMVWADCLQDINPVAYWRLDETGTPYDDSYGTNIASCGDPDSVCPTRVVGELVVDSQAFAEGSTTGLKADATSGDFDWAFNSSFTIALWVKADDASGTDVFIGRVDTSGGALLRWFVGASGATTFATARIQARNGEGGAAGELLTGTTDILDGVWHYIVVVRDNSAGKNLLYVDGALEASVDVTYTDDGSGTASFASANPVNIGWMNTSGGFRMTGALDEVAIYDQALPAGVIAQQFLNGQEFIGYCDNTNPVITSTADNQAVEDELYTYTPVATDGDGDTLTWSIDSAPAGMTFDTTTGEINWTPAQGTASPVNLTITVDDGHGGTASEAIAITILPAGSQVNHAPSITSTAVTKATEGVQYKYSATATDTDGDTLTWSLSGAPKGMAVSASGVVTWTPATGTSSSSPVTYTLIVSDGNGGQNSQAVKVTVSAAGSTPSSGGGGGGGGCFIETTITDVADAAGTIALWILAFIGSALVATVRR